MLFSIFAARFSHIAQLYAPTPPPLWLPPSIAISQAHACIEGVIYHESLADACPIIFKPNNRRGSKARVGYILEKQRDIIVLEEIVIEWKIKQNAGLLEHISIISREVIDIVGSGEIKQGRESELVILSIEQAKVKARVKT